jgi:pimeloyl-ACP methyl ester carboxylesterase
VGPRGFRRAARGALHLATLARDHLALLDALGIDECVLVGLSIGGMWGVELARMAPARLKGLVLMDSFVGLEPQITCERYLGMLAMIEQVGTVPPIAEQVAPLFFAHQPDAALMSRFQGAARPMARRQGGEPGGGGAQLRDPGGSHRLARRDEAAALVMTGCEDKARPVLEGYLMAEVLGCPFREIPGLVTSRPWRTPRSSTGRWPNFSPKWQGDAAPDSRKRSHGLLFVAQSGWGYQM